MRHLKIGLAAWTVVWIPLMLAALLVSDGEPICEGPLTLGMDDSDPPQCDDPIVGLMTVAPRVFVASGLVVVAVVAVLGIDRRFGVGGSGSTAVFWDGRQVWPPPASLRR